MGKKIRISEEQAIRLFGAGAVKNLQEADGGKYDSVGFNTSFRDPSVSKDRPMGASTLKMRNLGNTNLDDTSVMNTGNDFVNAVVKYIYQINGGPVGIMDALEIVNKLKGKDVSKELGDAGLGSAGQVKSFLDTLDIATIFSNYLVMDQQDYVYYRLANLTPEEITTIKETYGKDFSTWGTKCDGCGLEEWQTNVFIQSGNDAHINLEYMGSAGKSSDGKSLGSMKSYRIPFEIHHMNDNPSDNSPLNLSCLCPNCHSLTGSYGKSKGTVNIQTLQQIEDKVKPVNTDAIAEEIKQRLTTGHFQDMSISKKMTTNSLPEIGVTEQELTSGINNMLDNIQVWINEHGKDIKALSATKSSPIPIGEIGGREFRATVLFDSDKDRYWVRLFSDIGDSQNKASNFEGKLIEFVPNGPNHQKMIDQMEAFIVRTLTSTKPNQVMTSPWATPSMNPTNVNQMSKVKDPDAYNEKFKDLNGFDPHSSEKRKTVDPKKLAVYNRAKEQYEKATTPTEKNMWAKVMRQSNPYG